MFAGFPGVTFFVRGMAEEYAISGFACSGWGVVFQVGLFEDELDRPSAATKTSRVYLIVTAFGRRAGFSVSTRSTPHYGDDDQADDEIEG